MTVTASAPGKLLLFGEHAVVYDRPSLVTAVDQRIRTTVELAEKHDLVIHAPDVQVSEYQKSMNELGEGNIPKSVRFVEEAVRQYRDAYQIQGGVIVSTKSDFSSQFGFGSSSASVVCTLHALSVACGKPLSTRALFRLAYQTILSVQGSGSGFDVAAAVYGGTLYFRTGGKIIEPLSVTPPPIVVGYTGLKADTSAIVSDVARKMKAQPERVGRIYDSIQKLTDEARERMIEGDWKRVGRLAEFNQEYLRDLGVSSEKLEALISAAKSAGAWGAKLSGAGVGDCMIAFVSGEARTGVEDAIRSAGGQVIHIHASAPGVRTETDDQDELFVVVDEKDEILGYKPRYMCHHDKSLLHRAVELFIFDAKGRILLQKRSHTKDIRAGYWSTSVGGHVGKGESYQDAMQRELKEELGIDIPVTFHSKRVVEFPAEREMEALFTAAYDGPFRPNEQEVAEVRFFDAREIRFGVADGSLKLTEAALNNLKALKIL